MTENVCLLGAPRTFVRIMESSYNRAPTNPRIASRGARSLLSCRSQSPNRHTISFSPKVCGCCVTSLNSGGELHAIAHPLAHVMGHCLRGHVASQPLEGLLIGQIAALTGYHLIAFASLCDQVDR